MLSQTLPHNSTVNYSPAPRAFADKELVRFLKPGMQYLTGCVLGYRRDLNRYEVRWTEVHARARGTSTLVQVAFFAAEELVAFGAVSR